MAEPGPLKRPALADTDYPDDPYPGARPDFSFIHRPDGSLVPLDRWEPDSRDRTPVLAYGSNACPSKISWLRSAFGLTGEVVVLRCRTVGVSAVWSAGRRIRDRVVPAVLVRVVGVEETHAVWLATPDQLEVLDRCERIAVQPAGYQRIRLEPPIEVRSDDGVVLEGVQTYVGAGPVRAPMLSEGRVVRLTDLNQAGAQRLLDDGAVAGDWRFDAHHPC